MKFLSPPSPANYYLLSWRWVILLVIFIVLLSDSTRTWVTLPAFIASLILMTSLSSLVEKYRILWNVSILGAVGLFAFNQTIFVATSGDLASLMIEILVGILPVSLAFRDKERSYWLALLNVTLIAVGSILVSDDLGVYGLLLIFLITLIFSLNSANLYFLTKGTAEANIPLPRGFFIGIIRVLPVGLLAGALIFFLFPRVKNLNSWLGIEGQKSSTGYTGGVSLTGGREIGESDALVFLVEANDEFFGRSFANDLLFRGNSLSQFDGVSWSNLKTKRTGFAMQNLRVSKSNQGRIHSLKIYRQPNYTKALFYPGVLLSIEDPSRKVGGIYVDAKGNLTRGKSQLDRYSYSMTISEPHQITVAGTLTAAQYKRTVEGTVEGTVESLKPKKIGKFNLSDEDYLLYTQIPEQLQNSEYFIQYSDRTIQNWESKTIPSLAFGLKNYFSANFEASLVNQFSAADTFKAFLTTDKRGHCEYFSTATALYFRSIGVPARIVLGYRGGIYNRVSQLFEVREKSAHAWVEVFVPNTGWIQFDPTPNSLQVGGESALSNVELYISAAKFWFNRYVIDYDRDAQVGIFRSIQGFKFAPQNGLKFAFASAKYWAFPAILLSIALILMWTLRKIRRDRNPYRRFPRVFQIFIEKLEKSGHKIELGESLGQFHTRLIGLGLEPSTVTKMADMMEEFTYSSSQPDKSKYFELQKEIKTLKIPSAVG